MKKIYALVIAVLLSLSYSNAQDSWQQRATYPGNGTTVTPTCFTIGNKGYVIFYDRDVPCNYLWEYNPSTDSWTQMLTMNTDRLDRAVAFVIGNIGYYGTSNNLAATGTHGDFYAYDPSSNTYVQKASVPVGRSGAIGFAIGGKGYVGTGYLGQSSSFSSAELYEYDPSADTWTPKAPIPVQRTDAAVVVVNNKAYVFAGRSAFSTYLNDTWVYDPANDNWSPKSNFPGPGRLRPVGYNFGDKIFIGIGSDLNGARADFYEYNTLTDSWQARTSCPQGSMWASGFTLNGYGYAVGGFGNTSLLRYTPPIGTAITEAENANYSVYPNPANQFLNIESDAQTNQIAKLYDLSGKVILEKEFSSATTLNTSSVAEGNYLLIINDGKNNFLQKQLVVAGFR